MADPPSREDFFKGRGFRRSSQIKDFVSGLQENVPTLFPAEMSQAVGVENKRGSITQAAKKLKLTVRTLLRDGEIWALRLEKHNDREPK